MDVTQKKWDFIIVGTGMGGATLGYALAKAGKSVLFCEKGRDLRSSDALRGRRLKELCEPETIRGASREDYFSRAGRSTLTLADADGRHVVEPLIGCGTGGSTALFGMILERLFPSDFQPRANFPLNHDGASLPERWPIQFADLLTYYEAAEKLYRVKGTPDPLAKQKPKGFMPSPPLSPVSRELFDFFKTKGCHPYQVPRSFENVPGCESCMGYLCPQNCKNDSARICLEPALQQHGAVLIDRCEVEKLQADRSQVTGVICMRQGERLKLQARTVILAAGALVTPAILLNSVSPVWPQGLANDSGMVGRNLMRHLVDLYVIWPKQDPRSTLDVKEIAFNDFYAVDGEKLGTVQSFGKMFPAMILTSQLETQIRQSALSAFLPLFRLARPVTQRIIDRYFGKSIVFASLLEDLPYASNCVYLPKAPAGTHALSSLGLDYRISQHDLHRLNEMRRRMKTLLKPYRTLTLQTSSNNGMMAHVCGTVRFGDDPKTSVLDSTNRAHGIGNLYVVDGSFFPSSTGTNPALTIAANALRVSEKILAKDNEQR